MTFRGLYKHLAAGQILFVASTDQTVNILLARCEQDALM